MSEPTPDPDGPSSGLAATAVKLAGRDQRLMAAITDGLLVLVCTALGMAAAVQWFDFKIADPDSPLILQGVIYVSALPLMLVQWTLVAKRGQTIGKYLQKIRIVRMDGSAVGFWHGVVLRSWLLGVVSAVIGCVRLVDYAYIFREDIRCLHDLLADTQVIDLNPEQPAPDAG